MDILKTNAKKLSPQAQYEIRKSIVRANNKGLTPKEIVELLGVSKSHVYSTLKQYKNEGIKGIKPEKRGRSMGENRILTPEQEKEIQRLIVDNNPEQLKFKEFMWTRKNIRALIKQKYRIEMNPSTLGYYLARWGFSVQRPIKRAYGQDEQQINAWLSDEFPGITAKAEAENAEIFFGDETGIQNTANYAKGYAPKGKTPVIRVHAKKIRINMLSAVSKRGKLRFMLYKDNMNSDKLIDFMRRLVNDSSKKVFLVLDNLRVHHSKKVMEWVDKNKDKIEIFYLPPYAPEYNPDELVNSDLKRGIGNKMFAGGEEELESGIRSHMKILQNNGEKVKSFFRAEKTKYAG